MSDKLILKAQRNENLGPLTFGFDIGIASVGWAVLNETRVVALGVRAFDKAETAKEGDSLNLVRRSARLMRRRLRRRAWRLTRLGRLLKRFGVIENADYFKTQPSHSDSAWELRVAALSRLLTPEEWARVLYHLCKHRGFYWVSRAEEAKAEGDATGEAGKVKKNLAATAKLMKDKEYDTAAQMILAEFPDAQRNKQGEYTKALSRILLGEELKTLFEAQRSFGNQYASTTLELEILGTGDRKSGLFWLQKPSLAGKDLLKMLGHCTFEKSEYRAAKASFTAERHVWLTRLNNVRITVDGKSRPLNEAERSIALLLPYKDKADGKFTYKHLRNALVASGLDTAFRFTGFSYPSAQQILEKKAKSPEDDVMVKLSAWHELRLKFNRVGLDSEWLQISTPALDGDSSLLDQIGWVLSVYKEDEEVQDELLKLQLPGGEATINALLTIRFDKFHALSLKALLKIIPPMQRGLRYDEACVEAGYHHSQLHKVGKGEERLLPPLYSERDKGGKMVFNEKLEELDMPRNPVVLRSINQSRKVLNALVKEYGSPSAVHIELARDLSRPLKERNEIKKEQDAFRDKNERDRSNFASEYGIAGRPRGGDFEKWRLYHEQQCKCAYTTEPIDIDRLLEVGYVEVDHALPYSRSFDDSKNNKVLVFAKVNREKGNRTPYEYLDGANNSLAWRTFVGFAQSNKSWRQAKLSRLLRKDFGVEETKEFRDRNLNDTRYIAKFFKNYVERYLKLEKQADGSQTQRCVVLSGQLTAFLRAHWGLIKIREESDRHHALDAVVIAACSQAFVKRLSDHSRNKELAEIKEGFIDWETGDIINPTMHTLLNERFPKPWPGFRDEVIDRLKIDDPALLSIAMQSLGSYSPDDLAELKPLFVSRAPQRRNSGAVHKETIYKDGFRSEDALSKNKKSKYRGDILQNDTKRVTKVVLLSQLKPSDLDRLVDPHRNKPLYDAIRQRLDAYASNGGKFTKSGNTAFAETPLRKPLANEFSSEVRRDEWLKNFKGERDASGNPLGPIVRSVRVEDNETGIPIRGGLAKNDTMLRVNVFNKAGKFHLVPVYIHHLVSGIPNRAIVQGKDEANWTLIDDTFNFCFSLHPCDLIRITQKGKPPLVGYYAGCNRATGSIDVWAHDRNQSVGKDGLIQSIGVKIAVSLEKFDVDVLGNIYPAKPELEHGLA